MSALRPISPAAGLRGLALGAACVVALVGCSDDRSEQPVDGGADGLLTSAPAFSQSSPFFERMNDAPFNVHYRGTRRVVMHRAEGRLEFIEEVGCDGSGAFAVEVETVIESPSDLDPMIAELLLENRGRFGVRARDPRVRSLWQFELHWRATQAAAPVQVAGHDCIRYEIERNVPLNAAATRYVLDIEPRSALVLRWSEESGPGNVVSTVEYETFEFGADVSDMDLRASTITSSDLDVNQGLQSQFGGAKVHQPNLSPPGFLLESARRLDLATGEIFAQFTFTDGFEQVFFLHEIQPGVNTPISAVKSALNVVPYGNWTLGAGDVAGVPVLVAGKITSQHLAELIQSSLGG